MQKQKSIKVNFFMNALLTMSSVVFPLITSSHVARVLGPNGTGIVDFVSDGHVLLDDCTARYSDLWYSYMCKGQR